MEVMILFPLGVRLSTWIVLGVFLVLGLRDRRYWLAAAAWLVGFELVFQITSTTRILIRGGLHPSSWWQPVVVFGAYLLGLSFVWVAAQRGARPSLLILGLSLGLWIVLLKSGLHTNGHTMSDFSVESEALNEGSKTLWALAYLIPLI